MKEAMVGEALLCQSPCMFGVEGIPSALTG